MTASHVRAGPGKVRRGAALNHHTITQYTTIPANPEETRS